jgi:ATP-dependent DNA ligase I
MAGMPMLLAEIAATSDAVASASARLAKVDRLADCLRRLEPHEIAIAVAFLSGELRQRQIGVGYATLRDLLDPSGGPAATMGAARGGSGRGTVPPEPPDPSGGPAATLTLADADAAFERIGQQTGPGSQSARRQLLAALFAAATPAETRFLIGLLSGELRQGALEGVMVEATARAAGIPAREVRRALMLRGALGPVAMAALTQGVPGLRAFHLQVGRPLQPMLAQTATSIHQALERITPAAVEWKLDGTRTSLSPETSNADAEPSTDQSAQAALEWKLDGIRVGIHKDGSVVRVFTRTLDDITARVPEVLEVVSALPVRSAVFDGEVIALQDDGRPQPFQVTAGRLGSKLNIDKLRSDIPLTLFLFDLLHLNGEDLIDSSGADRHRALASVTPERLRVPRTVTSDPSVAEAFLRDALAHGHEGVLVKSLSAPYAAGRRGAGWIKVKPRHTLDLVVLAAEWGHGRRRGWLSNLHLGARDPETGGFVMLGKTFKGLTDAMLTWQTERLLELATDRNDWVVHVRPELVVEIAFDGVQRSPRYPGGLALRFARVLRYRDDKRAVDSDTIDLVRAIHAGDASTAPDSA